MCYMERSLTIPRTPNRPDESHQMPQGLGGVAPSISPSTHCLWFQLQWPPEWAEVNIAVKELVPVTLSATIWGHTWHKQKIVFKSDNMAMMVIALNKRSAKDPRLCPTYCGVCSSLKHILASNTKPSTSLVLIMWGPMHFPAVISLVFTLFSQRPRI